MIFLERYFKSISSHKIEQIWNNRHGTCAHMYIRRQFPSKSDTHNKQNGGRLDALFQGAREVVENDSDSSLTLDTYFRARTGYRCESCTHIWPIFAILSKRRDYLTWLFTLVNEWRSQEIYPIRNFSTHERQTQTYANATRP